MPFIEDVVSHPEGESDGWLKKILPICVLVFSYHRAMAIKCIDSANKALFV